MLRNRFDGMFAFYIENDIESLKTSIVYDGHGLKYLLLKTNSLFSYRGKRIAKNGLVC